MDDRTSNQDYLSNLEYERSKKLRPGTTVRQDGKLEGESETTDKYSAKRAERSKFKLKQDLITPYGNFAGSAVRLGDPKRYRSNPRAISV